MKSTVDQEVQEYQPYKDHELPPTYQGDFHGNRREERNRFLLHVKLTTLTHDSYNVLYFSPKVREQVLSKVRSGRAKLTVEDVIHYDIIPNIRYSTYKH